MTVLTALELATGILFGDSGEPAAPLPPLPRGQGARAALENACTAALQRGPCLVSFSGGRDSSLVLAAAANAARREGLALPVPVTNRFASVAHSHESDWQELLVAKLGLTDWVRLELSDELDVVGELATRGLRRHGLLWPFNAHFHAPLLELASGGTLLTGIGGDELLGSSRWAHPLAVLSGSVRPRPRDVARLGLIAAPPRLRTVALARRAPEVFPWLRPAAARALGRAWAADQAREPMRLAVRLRRLPQRRALRVGLGSLDLLAADAGAAIAHPLLDPRVLAAVAAAGPRGGWIDRTHAMRALFAGLLPAELLARSSKAHFDGAFWGPGARRFAASWQGEAIESGVVDPSALARLWAGPEPDAHTFLLLQAAWLERHGQAQLDDRPVARIPSAA